MKKIVILSASSGKNLELAKTIETEAKLMGVHVTIVDLAANPLPIYTQEKENDGIPQGAKDLSTMMIEANALVFLAPEYNGSIPPTLNNAIAWISRTGDDWRSAFNSKPTLIGTHSGGGGTHVLMAMRMQLSFIGANVIGRQLLTNFLKPLNHESLVQCMKQLV